MDFRLNEHLRRPWWHSLRSISERSPRQINNFYFHLLALSNVCNPAIKNVLLASSVTRNSISQQCKSPSVSHYRTGNSNAVQPLFILCCGFCPPRVESANCVVLLFNVRKLAWGWALGNLGVRKTKISVVLEIIFFVLQCKTRIILCLVHGWFRFYGG